MTDQLLQAIGGGTGKFLSNVFKSIQTVAEEIELAIKKYPMQADLLDPMFMEFQLQAHEMQALDDRVFRSHVQEILERIGTRVGKKALEKGTKAEVLVALMNSSFIAPLNQSALALYEKLFTDIIGKRAFNEILGASFPARGAYPGETDELLEWARQRVRQERRTHASNSTKSKKDKGNIERQINVDQDTGERNSQITLPGLQGWGLDRDKEDNHPSGLLADPRRHAGELISRKSITSLSK